jgi:hypothetical protein
MAGVPLSAIGSDALEWDAVFYAKSRAKGPCIHEVKKCVMK